MMQLLNKFAKRRLPRSTCANEHSRGFKPRVSTLPVLVATLHTSRLQWVSAFGIYLATILVISISFIPTWLTVFAIFVTSVRVVLTALQEKRAQDSGRQLVWHSCGKIELTCHNGRILPNAKSPINSLWQGHLHVGTADSYLVTNLKVQVQDKQMRHLTIWRDAVNTEEYRKIRARIRLFPVTETSH